MDVVLEASADAVPRARRAVCEIAAASGATREDLDRIGLAVSEAVTNAIVHGYGEGGEGSIQLIAAGFDGEVSVLVADDGCGLGSARASCGLGLGMGVMEYSADVLTITTRASGGTLIEMRFALVAAQPVRERRAVAAHPRGSVASAICPA